MKIRLFVATCALGLMAVSSASGALILHINTTDKTYAFTGSDTGTLTAFNFTQWTATCGFSGTGFEGVVPTGLSSSPDALVTDSGYATGYIDSRAFAGNNGVVFMQLRWSSPGVTETVTGNGVYLSYASMSALAAAQFESLIGGTMSPIGSTFQSIAVTGVPEPTSCALLGLGAAVLGLRRRVRKA